MKITTTLTTLYVRDCEQSADWYGALFERTFDRAPMPSCREWDTAPGATVQVISNPQRAGKTAVALVLDDFEAVLSSLRGRRVAFDEVKEVPNFILWTTVRDPDGNEITLVKSLTH